MRIDSHQHFWKFDRGDYGWLETADAVLRRDFLPDNLRPILERYRIDKTIVVQAAPTVAETDFLLDLAGETDFIAGVVGWLGLDSLDFPAQLEKYRQNPWFIGVRPMLQDLPDDDWILRPRVIESLRLIASADFPFDLLTFPRHLKVVLKVLERVPGLRGVIDHISKPEIKAQNFEPWKTLIAEAAQYPNLYCKLSGMITEADHRHWTVDHLRPYIEHVLENFGKDRVMFGSDWPVCLLAGEYGRVISALTETLGAKVDRDFEDAIFGENAQRFYKLDAYARR